MTRPLHMVKKSLFSKPGVIGQIVTVPPKGPCTCSLHYNPVYRWWNTQEVRAYWEELLCVPLQGIIEPQTLILFLLPL